MTTQRSLFIQHPSSTLRVNLRGSRVYITMKSNGTSVTMALTPEEALALASYLQAKANIIIARGAFIGVKGQAGQTKAARTAKAGRKAEAKGGETTPAPKQTEEAGEVGEEDIGEEEE